MFSLTRGSLVNSLDTTSNEAGSAGGNKTDLLTSWRVSGDSRRVTDVLMVTTTMRMLYWVHSNTSNSGPSKLLGVVLKVSIVGLKQGLVSPLSASDDADHSSAGALDGSSDARWQSNAGLLAVFRVADHDG